MPAQATRVNQLVCDALGLDVEPGRWRALTRQVPDGASLEARIRSLGGAVDVGYVDRTLSMEELQAAVTAGVFPVVLLGPAQAAQVVTRDDDLAPVLLQVAAAVDEVARVCSTELLLQLGEKKGYSLAQGQ